MSETTATERPEIGYSALTGNVYVLLRNGQKRLVPEAEVVAVIAGWLDDHDLIVTKPDGRRVSYEAVDGPVTPLIPGDPIEAPGEEK